MPTITEEPEPEPEALAQQQQILQLLQFLAAPQPEVVEQALAAVLAFSDDPEGIALLRDLPPPANAPDALLQLAVRSVATPQHRTDAAIALVNLSCACRCSPRPHSWPQPRIALSWGRAGAQPMRPSRRTCRRRARVGPRWRWRPRRAAARRRAAWARSTGYSSCAAT